MSPLGTHFMDLFQRTPERNIREISAFQTAFPTMKSYSIIHCSTSHRYKIVYGGSCIMTKENFTGSTD
jgi:hypothetical protein